MKKLPTISVIIPTLNAESQIDRCLRSIRNQIYPSEIQIIVSDGGSTDQTLKWARMHRAMIVLNPDHIAEHGKNIALAHATGDLVVFMDADNEISDLCYFAFAAHILQISPATWGVESYYPANKKMSSFNSYLTELLHISDPVSWYVSKTPYRISKSQNLNNLKDYEFYHHAYESQAWPLGANGFMYRRADLNKVMSGQPFEDTKVAMRVCDLWKPHRFLTNCIYEFPNWARVRGMGVHHYYANSLSQFLCKRRRQTFHFFSQPKSAGISWSEWNPTMSPIIACIVCATLIFPLWHGIRNAIKSRDARWLWHPVASLLSVLGIAWGIVTYKMSPKTKDFEATLQPKA